MVVARAQWPVRRVEVNPQLLRRPANVADYELWCKVGDAPPADATGCVLIKRSTKARYTHQFSSADFGKTAYWMFRWVSRKGDPGPFSAVVSAKIMG